MPRQLTIDKDLMKLVKSRLHEGFRSRHNARVDVDCGVPIDEAHFLQEIREQEKQIAAEAAARFHEHNNSIQVMLRPRVQHKERREQERDGIEQAAGNEPRIRPDVPFWLDRLVAVIAAIVEFGISLPVLNYWNLPPGLAATLACGMSIATLWAAHRFATAARKQVKSRYAANLFVICIALGCALPLAVALTCLRKTAFETFQSIDKAFSGSGATAAASAPGMSAGSGVLVLLLVTLSMLFLAAIFRFDSEYAGSRFGLKKMERELQGIQKEIDRLETQLETLSALYQTVCAGIQARFNRMELAYRKTYTRRAGRRRCQRGK